MSIQEKNLAIVKSAYDAFFRKDLDGFTASFTDDTELFEVDTLPYGGIHRGKQGFLALIEQVMAVWEGLDLTIHEYLAGGDHVAVYGELRVTSKATGKTAVTTLVEIWHIVDGRTRRLEVVYGDTAQILATAGLSIPGA